MASMRAHRTTIEALTDPATNELATTTAHSIRIARSFYQDLFASHAPPQPEADRRLEIDDFLCPIENHLSPSQKDKLDCRITKDEIWTTLMQMDEEKTPGLDGFPKEFWETMWPLLSDDLMSFYNEVWESGDLGELAGQGVLSLIHKKSDKMNIRNYRPITLLTVVYKMLSKALANRLIDVIEGLIHPAQTGFLRNRNIQENILLINQMISLAQQSRSNAAFIFIDFEKAYDHVDWLFLDRCLERMNFGMAFRRWINILHRDATMRVQINGSLTSEIKLQRFVRQGDPIAPFLFIIVMEALAANLRHSRDLEKIRIAGIPEDAILVCSLFADDLTIMVVDQYTDLMQEPFGLPNRPTKHRIELLPGSVPPKGRVYRMSPAELEELRKQLETLTNKGWIRPNTSEFGAPVLFVPKGNDEFRMCIDYRGLNKITRKSTKPLPRIDDLLDMVQGCTVFSKVDLKSGYHQIEMAEEDVYKTAFKTRYGTYEFLVMPFGLCKAPCTFQTEMHRIFRPYLNKFMVVYLDDILVFSRTAREHAEHLALVLESLRDNQYKINREKSSFGVPSVIYLGHVISGDGLAPEGAKITAIQEWFQPQTENNLFPYDVSSTEPYQRDNLMHFLWYWCRFWMAGALELPYYAYRRGRFDLMVQSVVALSIFVTGTAKLYGISSVATTWVIIIPFFIASFALMFGNWSQHIFIDPAHPRSNYLLT
ncbi:hypothetical protein CBR_g8636 [Chara braunii]|uniref:Reverse transcriptase domain-containing protein n=1 Tax=Chara braunii TaxID=69332 RepID=A0A388JS56_CHABU|nr:hypothetical protein CBR_g8636 [Chara braunii]|eukprot:GBG60615.1 hypothetical protein CBR_g8636 [Chara braunii]